MNTRTMPIAVPIQLSGQVISMNARHGLAPLIFATSSSSKLKLTSDR